MTREQLIDQLRRALNAYAPAYVEPLQLLKDDVTKGKLYEAFVLSTVLEEICRSDAGISVRMVNGTYLYLRGKGAPIDRSFPHFEVYRDGLKLAEVFTDVYFTSRSAHVDDNCFCTTSAPQNGPADFHELDIVMVRVGAANRPCPEQIVTAIECKDCRYEKHYFREALGVRRELGILALPKNTKFPWPRTAVHIDPPTCFMVYCTDEDIINYSRAAEHYGIDVRYLPIS